MADAQVSEKRRCRARSKQSQEQCKRFPAPGAVVCKVHGAGAPQVKRAARQRLLEAADPLVARLVEIAETSDDEAVAVRAITAVLDRAGYGPTATQVQVDGGELGYQIDGVDLGAL